MVSAIARDAARNLNNQNFTSQGEAR
jgi:hypothetical protein